MNYWILTKLLAVSPPVESTLKLDMTSSNGQVQMTMPVQIMILLTLLTFLPAIIISLSSFTRIIIVFHFLRRSEEHTSELQSRFDLVCRLLLEKKKNIIM